MARQLLKVGYGNNTIGSWGKVYPGKPSDDSPLCLVLRIDAQRLFENTCETI